MLRNISSCLFPHISTITSPNHYLSEWDDWEKQGLPEEQRTEAVRRLRACLTSKGINWTCEPWRFPRYLYSLLALKSLM